MGIIKKGMSVNCRNRDEVEVFNEVATAEGHFWLSGTSLKVRQYDAPISFQVGYADNEFPLDITWSKSMNFVGESEFINSMTVIEASDLFRNRLIARRAKHERDSTK